MEHVTQIRTLKQHREALAGNPDAYTADLPRLSRTLVKQVKLCGFRRAALHRCGSLLDELVDALFEAQGRQPFFHVDSPLPHCWNEPKHWDKNYILYEWGHLRSRNQNNNAHSLDNLCLQSARCNRGIQTSLDIAEVLEWASGSRLATRIRQVLDNRAALFASPHWAQLTKRLDEFR